MSRRKRQSGKRKRSSRSSRRRSRQLPVGPANDAMSAASVKTESAASVAFASDDPAAMEWVSEESTQSVRSPLSRCWRRLYRLDFAFNGLHAALDWTQDVMEFALELFLRVFMTKPVQFTAGALTGVFCLMLVYQVLVFAFAFFATSYYL